MTARARRALTVLGVLACLALLVGAGSYWLFYTQPGAKWGFERLGAFFPGRLDVKGMRGPLRGPIEIKNFAYRSDSLAITADRVFLRWDLRQLLKRRLDIYQLHGDNVTVVWGAAGTTPEARDSLTGPVPDLNLPVTVIIREGILNRIAITRPGRPYGPGKDSSLVIDRVELDARSVRRDSLRVNHLTVRSKWLDFQFAGVALPRGAYPLFLRGTWEYRPERIGPVRGSGTLAGTLDSLRVVQLLSGPFSAEVDLGLIRPFRSRPLYRGTIRFSGLSPRQLDPDLPEGTFGGQVVVTGDRARLETHGAVHGGPVGALGPVNADFHVRRANDLWHIDQLTMTRAGFPTRFSATGTVSGPSKNAFFDLETHWASAGWPLQGEPLVESERGSARIRGTSRDFGIHLEALLAGRDLPPGRWQLVGRGGGNHLRIRTVIADILDGRIVGQGSVAWGHQTRWNLTFDGKGINPAVVWPAYPGSLDFAGQSQGVQGRSGPSGKILVSRLAGTLRDQPISGTGTVTAGGGQYSLSQAAVQWGPNRAEANGRFGRQWSLDWKLQAPQLGAAIAQGSGSLEGSGNISGPQGRQRFTGTLAGDSLFVGTAHARSIRASGDIDLAPGGLVRLDVVGTQVDAGSRSADHLTITASGTRDRHVIRASVADLPDSTVAVLTGGIRDGIWSGQLGTLDFVNQRAGHWALASPARVSASPSHVELADFIWQSGSARATVDGDWTRNGPWHLDSRLDQVPLTLIAPALPPRLRLEGVARGHVTAHATADGHLYADVDVTPGPGQILHNTASGQWVATRFENAHVRGTADGRRVELAYGADLVGNGTVKGSLAWPAFGDPSEAFRQPVHGTLAVHLRDLALAQGLSTELDATSGALDAELDISGTLDDPYFYGPLTLRNGSADVPRLGLQLRDMNVQGRGNANGQIVLDGSVRSGTGVLTLHGAAAMAPGAKPVANLRVTGTNIQAINSKDMEVLASPDLDFKLEGRRIDIQGEVTVPEGKIDVGDRYEDRRTVKASPDVVYTGTDTLSSGAFEVHSRIRLILGEKVNVRGFGLEAMPHGSVMLIDAPGLPTLGNGRLDITDGKYNVYGQALTVETGSLIFGGGPVTNPAVRARAVRTAANGVKAGFLVSGTLMQPNVQVFSEPAMGQSEALSYVMFGKPVESASLSEGQIASTMATTLGIPGTNLLAHGIASGLGIEEAHVEVGSGFQNTSVILGTHLSPKLYVSAGMDVFQATSSLRLRYILNRIFTIEAETAHQNRVDLLYTVER